MVATNASYARRFTYAPKRRFEHMSSQRYCWARAHWKSTRWEKPVLGWGFLSSVCV